jgi:hypothetical protein
MPTPSAEKATASAKLVGNVLWITRANLVACTDLLGTEKYVWQQHVTDHSRRQAVPAATISRTMHFDLEAGIISANACWREF